MYWLCCYETRPCLYMLKRTDLRFIRKRDSNHSLTEQVIKTEGSFYIIKYHTDFEEKENYTISAA